MALTHDGVAKTEADHFGNCPVCGALVDMRDFEQVLAHLHDAEIEICEGPGVAVAGAGCTAQMKEVAKLGRPLLGLFGVKRSLLSLHLLNQLVYHPIKRGLISNSGKQALITFDFPV